VTNRVLVIRLVQWLGWVFENKESKNLDKYSVTDFKGQFVSNYLVLDMSDIGSNTGVLG